MTRHTSWTSVEDETLRALYDQFKSFSQIGKILNRTKGSCISRSRRLRFPPRPELHVKRQTERTTAARHARLERAKNRTERRVAAKKGERLPPMLQRVFVAPDSVPVDLIARTGCCYAVTTESPHRFCNAPKGSGSDYCEFHHGIMYRRRAA